MTIEIAIDSETERLARRLAEAKGKAVPEIVREAIEASAQAAGVALNPSAPLTAVEKIARLRAISERSAARPLITDRTPDEVIQYDERGLPR